ncbi:MAG: SH3 domain-containing protein [Candidatus Woesearchaeota archaeon]
MRRISRRRFLGWAAAAAAATLGGLSIPLPIPGSTAIAQSEPEALTYDTEIKADIQYKGTLGTFSGKDLILLMRIMSLEIYPLMDLNDTTLQSELGLILQVIWNRKESAHFPDTLEGVLTQTNAFTPYSVYNAFCEGTADPSLDQTTIEAAAKILRLKEGIDKYTPEQIQAAYDLQKEQYVRIKQTVIHLINGNWVWPIRYGSPTFYAQISALNPDGTVLDWTTADAWVNGLKTKLTNYYNLRKLATGPHGHGFCEIAADDRLRFKEPYVARVISGIEQLNLRSQPNTRNDDNIISHLHSGDHVQVIGHEGVWRRVRVDRQEGWVHGQYVQRDWNPAAGAHPEEENPEPVPVPASRKVYYASTNIVVYSTDRRSPLVLKGTNPLVLNRGTPLEVIVDQDNNPLVEDGWARVIQSGVTQGGNDERLAAGQEVLVRYNELVSCDTEFLSSELKKFITENPQAGFFLIAQFGLGHTYHLGASGWIPTQAPPINAEIDCGAYSMWTINTLANALDREEMQLLGRTVSFQAGETNYPWVDVNPADASQDWKSIEPDYSKLRPGDLVMFAHTYAAGGRLSHVGIYLGQTNTDDPKHYFIHSGSPCKITAFEDMGPLDTWEVHYVGAVSVIPEDLRRDDTQTIIQKLYAKGVGVNGPKDVSTLTQIVEELQTDQPPTIPDEPPYIPDQPFTQSVYQVVRVPEGMAAVPVNNVFGDGPNNSIVLTHLMPGMHVAATMENPNLISLAYTLGGHTYYGVVEKAFLAQVTDNNIIKELLAGNRIFGVQ